MKIDKTGLFNLVLERAQKVSGFNPSPEQLEFIEIGFYGIFRGDGKGFRRSPPKWQAYVNPDETINIEKLVKFLQHAFCKLWLYHIGRLGNSVGALIGANEMLCHAANELKLVPHKVPQGFYRLSIDSPEFRNWESKRTENRAAERQFADYCDTFIQVLVYILSDGMGSSVPGAIWRRALGVDA